MAKVLRKASALPITFRGRSSSGVGGDRGGGGGVDSVGGGVAGVTGHVGGSGGVTGGTGGSSAAPSSASRAAAWAATAAARACPRYLATRPGAPCFDGFARSVVFRVLLLEVWEHVLGAVGGPERQ